MRFRLYPTPEQEVAMLRHCADARYMWNVALEHWEMRKAFGRRYYSHFDRCHQLTDARNAYPWLRAGSVTVQQEALHDFDQALRKWWAGTHRHPTWREKGVHEGFRITGPRAQGVDKLNRKWSHVRIPKIGRVKFRRTRDLKPWKSYRIKQDKAGRWWIAFAVPPDPIPAPDNGEVVGIDRGITITMALSTGERWRIPRPTKRQQERLLRLERELARRQKDSNRREATRRKYARHHAQATVRRKDFVEKATTDVARRFDLIRIEDLRVQQMMKSASGTVEKPGKGVAQKRNRNRLIAESCWGMIDRRLHDKAPGRVEKVPSRYTSRRCNECGHTAPGNRKNQATFRCESCGHTANADVNAAKNIAARQAVPGHGDIPKAGPAPGALSVKCQPQPTPSVPLESSPDMGREDADHPARSHDRLNGHQLASSRK